MKYMKKLSIILSFLLLVSLFGGTRLPALDLEIRGGLGNISQEGERGSPLAKTQTFVPDLSSFYGITISGETGANLYFSGGYEFDPILKNRIFGNIGVTLDILTIEAGPFLGFDEIESFLDAPGLSFSARIEYPGYFFMGIQTASSLGSLMGNEGDFSQKFSTIEAGVSTHNMVYSFIRESKSYTRQRSDVLSTTDILNRTFFRIEYHEKNNPFTLTFDAGHQLLSRAYNYKTPPSAKNDLEMVFVGIDAEVALSRGFKFLLGGEIPIVNWTSNTMGRPDGVFLFSVHTGIILTLFP